MGKYVVHVNYLTEARVLVDAEDAESAEQEALDYVCTDEGFAVYMAEAHKNVGFDGSKRRHRIGGFDIPQNAYEYSDREYRPYEIIDLTDDAREVRSAMKAKADSDGITVDEYERMCFRFMEKACEAELYKRKLIECRELARKLRNATSDASLR